MDFNTKDSANSVFDDYDEENGYNDFEFDEIRRRKKDIFYALYRRMIKQNSSYKECRETPFCDYADFVLFELDNPIEEPESEVK